MSMAGLRVLVPPEDNHEAFRFAERLFAGEFEMAILLTGVGTLKLNRSRPRNVDRFVGELHAG